MKVAISFICGIFVCGLIIIGVRPVLPAMANTEANGEVTDNNTNFLTNLLPDIDKVYREALTSPFIKARAKIYDEDIAGYYDDLMAKTGLTDPNRD